MVKLLMKPKISTDETDKMLKSKAVRISYSYYNISSDV